MQARTKLIKNLEQQIEATTDPQLKADLSRQLTKLVTTAKRRGRPRKPEATAPSKKAHSLREKYAGCAMAELPDGKLVLHHLVLQIEKRRKAGNELKTKAERDVFKAEVLGALLENERAAYEAFEREGVA